MDNLSEEHFNDRKEEEKRMDEAAAGFLAEWEEQKSSSTILFERIQSWAKLRKGVWEDHMIKLPMDSLNELVGENAYSRIAMTNNFLQKVKEGGNATKWTRTRVLIVVEAIKNQNVNSKTVQDLTKKLLEETKRRTRQRT